MSLCVQQLFISAVFIKPNSWGELASHFDSLWCNGVIKYSVVFGALDNRPAVRRVRMRGRNPAQHSMTWHWQRAFEGHGQRSLVALAATNCAFPSLLSSLTSPNCSIKTNSAGPPRHIFMFIAHCAPCILLTKLAGQMVSYIGVFRLRLNI